MERTLIVFKPDAIKRGIVGEVLTRFEKAGLKIVGMKMVAPNKEHFHEHYEDISKLISRWGEDVYHITLAHMTETPVIAVVLEGVDVVTYVRKLVGTTDPQKSAPGTIRGDYTHISQAFANERGGTLPNILHASGDATEAAQEIALWFAKDELYDYNATHQEVVHGTKVKK